MSNHHFTWSNQEIRVFTLYSKSKYVISFYSSWRKFGNILIYEWTKICNLPDWIWNGRDTWPFFKNLQILTKDSVTVFVNAIMYYKVKDATLAVSNVDDYSGSSRLLAATTLRNILGTRNLGDILSERESIATEMKQTLDEATDPWGVQVERVEVKDVRWLEMKCSFFCIRGRRKSLM